MAAEVVVEVQGAEVMVQALVLGREPRSALDLMLPRGLAQMLLLALEPILRSVQVVMPRQAPVALSVMELVMVLAMEQGMKESDLKMALATDLQNSTINP